MSGKPFVAIALLLALSTLSCSTLGGGTQQPAEPTSQHGQPGQEEPTTAPTSPPEATPEPDTPPVPEAESPRIRPIDAMVMIHVPEGEFLMGDDASAFAPEKPAHMVYLDAYWIDKTEVTNAQYRLCVEAGVCPEAGFWWNEELNGDAQPVLVPWADAQTYCQWAGARLPTEAEWEKAMRGTDERIWPWGNKFVDLRANLSDDADGYGGTAPVGSFPDDVSPYGLLDAAGNAGEWVSDWFATDYYASSPARNPTGPASGDQRVHRAPIQNGGGGPEKCRTVARYGVAPNWEYGVRCVSPTAPSDQSPGASAPEATPAPAVAAPTATPEESADASGSEEASGNTGPWPTLQSYRIVDVMSLPEEGVPPEQFTFEWDAATAASRTVVGHIEEITIDGQRWTQVGDSPWIEETLSPEDQSAWEQKMAYAQLYGEPELIEDELEAALPEGVELVPAQIFPIQIKAAMVYDGDEVVNGIQCKRYTVDTDLDYTRPETGSHTTGHATGTIWIAAQAGIPPVIIRALMDEDLSVDGKASKQYWEHDITEVNQPIVIEAPE